MRPIPLRDERDADVHVLRGLQGRAAWAQQVDVVEILRARAGEGRGRVLVRRVSVKTRISARRRRAGEERLGNFDHRRLAVVIQESDLGGADDRRRRDARLQRFDGRWNLSCGGEGG